MTFLKKYAVWIVLLIYLALGVWGVMFHEPWRDEVEPFLIARDSSNPVELFINARYEGHPLLWYGILFLLTRVTHSVIALGLLHISIGVLTAYLFLKYSPFSWLNKILFLLGYYSLYEYFLISRNYSLVVLLLVILCILYIKKKPFIYKAVILALLTQAHVLGAVLAVTIFLLLTKEEIFTRNDNATTILSRLRLSLLSILLMGISVLFFLYSTWPLPDGYLVLRSGYSGVAFISLAGAYLPLYLILKLIVMKVTILPILTLVISTALSFFIFFFSVYLFRKYKPVLVIYSALTLAIIGCFVLIPYYFWTTRHIGILFIVFVVCCWIYIAQARDQQSRDIKQINYFLTFILVIQAIVGISYFAADFIRPFSNGRNVARFITSDNSLKDLPIAGYPDYTTQSVIAHYDRPAYYFELRAFRTFVYWNSSRKGMSDQAFADDIVKLVRAQNKDLLFVLAHESNIDSNLTFLKQSPVTIKNLASFNNAMTDENYTVYLIHLNE